MIKYDIYVENELAIPVRIDTSYLSEEYVLGWDKFFDLLPFSPQVIEYTDFGYSPNLGDTWDGYNFIPTSGLNFVNISLNTVAFRYFALIDQGIVKWIYMLQDVEQEGLIAALLSNPEFRKAE